MNNKQILFIRKAELLRLFSFSVSTLDKRIKDGIIPPPVSLGSRAVGFISNEIELVSQAMISEQSTSDIKKLVSNLLERRTPK